MMEWWKLEAAYKMATMSCVTVISKIVECSYPIAKTPKFPEEKTDDTISLWSVVTNILIMGSNVKESIIYVALLLWHVTNTTQNIVAPTMYLDVALNTMPLVSLAVIKTLMTLIIADIFITMITATPAT